MPTARLTRSETDKKIAGVAGGMASYFGLDPTLVRVLWVIALLMGWGFFAYVIFWIVLPKGSGSTPAMRLAEERYARGEITAEDLERIRGDLLAKGSGSTSAMQLAEQRYARGEITAADLERIRGDLEGRP
jgi:phage shock protein C